MQKRENATKRLRIYPSTYKIIKEASQKKRTSLAQIIHEVVSHSGSFKN